MIFGMCILLIFLGTMGLSMDLFVPITDMATAQLVGIMNMFGLMFTIVGLIVLAVRGYQTTMVGFFDLPKANSTMNFHHRRGNNPNVFVQKGKLIDLEYIKSKNKIFKDTGGGFRIAGHDCRNTYETICFDIPNWLSDYFYQLKQKTGIRNSDEFTKLACQLRRLKKPVSMNSYDERKQLETQLKDIELLEPIMNDHEKSKKFLDMGFDKIKRLELLCIDGITHHSEEVEDFIEGATPNELDALTKQQYLNDQMKARNYKEAGSTFNYEMLIPVGIGMFIAILGTIVFMSYIGGS